MKTTLINQDIQAASYSVKDGEELRLNMASFESFPSTDIEVHVAKDAKFIGALADFSKGSGTFRLSVFLEGEGASCEFHGAVLSKGSDKKTIEASCFHLAPHTEGVMENYGISENESHLVFTGVSQIQHGARASKTRQAAKIIVFDPRCLARCSPILKIDENDVSASHAAIVGKLNEDHMFYLMSRGLDSKEARRLITLGYLKPIETYFDEADRSRIDEAIEGGI